VVEGLVLLDTRDAEKFQARFGGEFIEPGDRPKWGGKK
jgi:hypothetical protein